MTQSNCCANGRGIYACWSCVYGRNHIQGGWSRTRWTGHWQQRKPFCGAANDSAMLARTSPVAIPADIVDALEPHLSWMLLQLDRATENDPSKEAPWVLVYAFKALLVSWQVLSMRTGQLDQTLYRLEVDGTAMDCGQAGLLAWFRRCINRRSLWGVGRVVERGLRVLEGT